MYVTKDYYIKCGVCLSILMLFILFLLFLFSLIYVIIDYFIYY